MDIGTKSIDRDGDGSVGWDCRGRYCPYIWLVLAAGRNVKGLRVDHHGGFSFIFH